MKVAFTRLINDNIFISYDERNNWSYITEDDIIIPPHTVEPDFDPGNGVSRTSSILKHYGYRFYRFNYRTEELNAATGNNPKFSISNNDGTTNLLVDNEKAYDNNFDVEVKNHINSDIIDVDLEKFFIKNYLNYVCQPINDYDMARMLKVNFSYETEETVVKSLKNIGLTTHGKLEKGTNKNVSLKITGLKYTEPQERIIGEGLDAPREKSFKLPTSIDYINTDTSLAYLIDYLNDKSFWGKSLIDLTPTYFPENINIGNNFMGLKTIYGMTFNQRVRNPNKLYKNNEGVEIDYENYNKLTEDEIKKFIMIKDNHSVDEDALLNCSNFSKFYLAPNIKRIEHGAFYNTNLDTSKVTFGDPDAWFFLGNPYDEDFLLGYKIDVSSPMQYYREQKCETREQENTTDFYVNYFKAPPSDTEVMRDGYCEATSIHPDIQEERKNLGRDYNSKSAHQLNHYFRVGLSEYDFKIQNINTKTLSGTNVLVNTHEELGNIVLNESTKLGIIKDETGSKNCLVDIYNRPVSLNEEGDAFSKERITTTNGNTTINHDFINICLTSENDNPNIKSTKKTDSHISRLYVDYLCYENADTLMNTESNTINVGTNISIRNGLNSQARLDKVKKIINDKTFTSMYDKTN